MASSLLVIRVMRFAKVRSRLLLKLSIAVATVGLVSACAGGGGAGTSPTQDGVGGGFDGDNTPQNEWPFDECGVGSYGKRVAGSMLVVLDRSGSMGHQWIDTRAGVTLMMDRANPELMVGLLPFPQLGCDYTPLTNCLAAPDSEGCGPVLADGCCGDVAADPAVPLTPAGQAATITHDWFQGASVAGFTPTLSALTQAYAYMKEQPSEGERYVVLFTDGAPTLAGDEWGTDAFQTCGSNDDILDQVAAAANGDNPVKTFAIAAPGAGPASSLLSDIAQLGGTQRSSDCLSAFGECHYTIESENFGEDLQAVLDQIAGLIGECTFDLPEGNEQAVADAVNVGIETPDGRHVIYRDAGHVDGWDYTDATKERIHLYGPSCDLYNDHPSNEVLIVLGCETLIL